MCWKSTNKPILMVAEKNIPVFKIMETNKDGSLLNSYYNSFVYRKNKIYTGSLDVPEVNVWGPDKTISVINKGFHSYSNDKCTADIKYFLGKKCFEVYYRDYLLDRYKVETSNIIRVNCIIPRGSHYYENGNGELVSDQIKIVCAGEQVVSQQRGWQKKIYLCLK